MIWFEYQGNYKPDFIILLLCVEKEICLEPRVKVFPEILRLIINLKPQKICQIQQQLINLVQPRLLA